MDYSEYDKVRRSAVPLQLDTVEAFAAGRLSRREFIQKATVLGLSTGAIGIVLAACSSTPSSAAPSVGASTAASAAASAAASSAASAAASGGPGGIIRVASQKPVSIDPVAMQDLGGYGITSQSFEFLARLTRRDRSPHRARPGAQVDAQRRRHRSGRSTCARTSSGMTAPLHRRRRRRDHGAPRRGRQLRPQGRAAGRWHGRQATRTRSCSRWPARTATSRTSCRCSTPRR